MVCAMRSDSRAILLLGIPPEHQYWKPVILANSIDARDASAA
jgi:hypothetical protein